MGNELFDKINPDAFEVATAIELFHNFSLIHDDIMDKAPLRRGKPTVHVKWNESAAILSGDVMFVEAYKLMIKVDDTILRQVMDIFSDTASGVCKGQQADMNFEKRDDVSLEEYIEMIRLKTAVLLAGSMQIGALIGGAEKQQAGLLYEFGENLGLAFQLQDDILDVYGDPEKFGKQVGGDILANKKTFLMIRALEVADAKAQKELQHLMMSNPTDKVARVLDIFRQCNVDSWAKQLKEKYMATAMYHLEEVAVTEKRKLPLKELAYFLIERDK
jgi:geranylgeranyl diphosphate synthase type II